MRLMIKGCPLAVLLCALCACSDDGGGGLFRDGRSATDGGGGIVEAGFNPDAGAPVTVSGVVQDGESEGPVAGATVSVVGASPANSTTTDQNGNWSLSIAQGAAVFVRAEATGFVSSQIGGTIPEGGTTEVEIIVVTRTFLNSLLSEGGLGNQPAGKGVAVVTFDGESGSGGERVFLSAGNQGALTFDSDDEAQRSDTLLPGGDSVIIFAGVDTGTTQLTLSKANGAAADCALTSPGLTDYRIDPDIVTLVPIECSVP